MMRDPLKYYEKEIERSSRLAKQATTEATEESPLELTEEDIIKRNEFIMDFIVKQ